MQVSKRVANIEPYYFADKLSEVRSLKESGKDIINLGIGNPDIDTPTPVIEELKAATNHKGSGQYQPYNGIPELRKAIANWYLRVYGVSLSPNDEILPLMGSKEAVMHIHLAFCNAGDTILVPNPGYPTYSSSAKMLGLNVCYYNLYESNNWMPSIEELEHLVTDNCKIMWINYPNMPTGANAEKKVFEKLISFASKHHLLLVNDNPYSLILNTSPLSIHSCNNDYKDVLELNSLSKSYNMAGFRVGIVSGNSENIKNILKVKSNFDSGMYKPIQLAAIKALNLGNEWTQKFNKEYHERIKLVWEILDNLKCTYNKYNRGMFVWAKVGHNHKTGDTLSNHLLYNYDVFVTPGNVFGSNGRNYVRLSLCAPQEKLRKTLNRIS